MHATRYHTHVKDLCSASKFGGLWKHTIKKQTNKRATHAHTWNAHHCNPLGHFVERHLPASWRTMASCVLSSKTVTRVGIAYLSCIWPRQYANSCFNRADPSSKQEAIKSMASLPPRFLSVNKARKRSFNGLLLSCKTLPISLMDSIGAVVVILNTNWGNCYSARRSYTVKTMRVPSCTTWGTVLYL